MKWFPITILLIATVMLRINIQESLVAALIGVGYAVIYVGECIKKEGK